MQASFHSALCNEKITPYSLISKHTEAVQNGGINVGTVAETESISLTMFARTAVVVGTAANRFRR